MLKGIFEHRIYLKIIFGDMEFSLIDILQKLEESNLKDFSARRVYLDKLSGDFGKPIEECQWT